MNKEPVLFTWKLLDHPELLKQVCETHGIDKQEFRERLESFEKETAELDKKIDAIKSIKPESKK
jgi:hypothetical protein